MLNLLNTGLILIFLGACGVLVNKKTLLIPQIYVTERTLLVLGGFIFSVFTVNILIIIYLSFSFIVPKILAFIFIILFFSIVSVSLQHLENSYYTNKKSSSPIGKINNIRKITVAAGGITAPGQPLTNTQELMSAYFAKYPAELQRA
jgi:hypothetical protein